MDAVLASPNLSREHKQAVKLGTPEVVVVGVGDTAEKPGRVCRNRLQLQRLSMFSGPEAGYMEAALVGTWDKLVVPTSPAHIPPSRPPHPIIWLLLAVTSRLGRLCLWCAALQKAHVATQAGSVVPYSTQLILVNDASVAVSTAATALRTLHQVR